MVLANAEGKRSGKGEDFGIWPKGFGRLKIRQLPELTYRMGVCPKRGLKVLGELVAVCGELGVLSVGKCSARQRAAYVDELGIRLCRFGPDIDLEDC